MIKSGVFLTTIVTLTLAGSPQSASADQIPGLRGHDHTGITVPDIKAATAFFTDVIGCTHAMSFGPFSDEDIEKRSPVFSKVAHQILNNSR